MKQLIQSFKTGELKIIETAVPNCIGKGAVVCTKNSFVSAGTEKMLVDFAKKNLINKAIAMPDKVKQVLSKVQSDGFFATMDKVKSKLEQPIPMGYSASGVVVEVPPGFEDLKIGDRVACGGVFYANHAEYNYIPANLMAKIPDNVSDEDASCATVGAIAMQGIRQCELQLGENVCIIGLGLLGLLAVQMAKANGCKVIGYDLDPARCELAMQLGATIATASDLESACERFTNNRGIDAVLIAAGTKSSGPVNLAGKITRQKGRVVAMGVVGLDLERENYYKKELDFKMSMSYGPGRYDPMYEDHGIDYPYAYVRWTEQRNMESFLDLISSGAISLSKIITHRFKFDDCVSAYDLLLGNNPEPYLGIVLNYDTNENSPLQRKINMPVNNKVDSTEKDCLNASFIGCGNFAKGVILPTLKKQNFNLAGLCTATGINSSETAKKHNFKFAATDFSHITEDKNTDVVFITTRHNTHAEMTKAALMNGKHVFVEKPLALNTAELDDLHQTFESLSSKNKLPVVMVGYNRRFSPHAKMIKEYFECSSEPKTINYRINAGVLPQGIWLNDPLIGGGRIVGEACHFIDLVQFLTNSLVKKVHAFALGINNDVEKCCQDCSINLYMEDGSIASLQYFTGGAKSLSKEYFEVHSHGLSATCDNFMKTYCYGAKNKKLKGKMQKGFSEELIALADGIKNGTMPIKISELFNCSSTTFAILESLATGTVVDVKYS